MKHCSMFATLTPVTYCEVQHFVARCAVAFVDAGFVYVCGYMILFAYIIEC